MRNGLFWAFAGDPGSNPHLENLFSAREATYGAIKDLESDHAQGKRSDADYQALRAKYENKALAILSTKVANSAIVAANHSARQDVRIAAERFRPNGNFAESAAPPLVH